VFLLRFPLIHEIGRYFPFSRENEVLGKSYVWLHISFSNEGFINFSNR
jgi:hypothetical protein